MTAETPVHDAERERLNKKRFIQTYTGKAFFPLAPDYKAVDILDIAHALAMKCRYTGHVRNFYSVAEHCVRVSRIVPPAFALPALLHDASEAYLPDLAAPIKRQFYVEHVAPAVITEPFKDIESFVLDAVFEGLGVQALRHVAESEQVKKADLQMLAAEVRDLINFSGLEGDPSIADWALTETPAFNWKIEPWTWQQAEINFLYRYEELTK